MVKETQWDESCRVERGENHHPMAEWQSPVCLKWD